VNTNGSQGLQTQRVVLDVSVGLIILNLDRIGWRKNDKMSLERAYKNCLIGKVLQGYEVIEHLATGGSSEIYVAKAPELDHASVVIKIAKSDNPKYNADLESLAKKLDVLNRYPTVIDILNTGKHKGRKFLVLEKADMSWKNYHKHTNITAKNAAFESPCLANRTIELLWGLEAAHEKGILHNDITPENILIHIHNTKLADFFTPEVYDEEKKDAVSSLRSVAEKDVVDDRLKYLAPEHKGLINAPVSERSDIYSLGVVLYETIMNSIPIGNYQKIGKKFPEIPNWFEFAVEKAIATEPHERWQSAKEMKEYLQKGLEGKLDRIPGLKKSAWNLAGKVKDAAITAGEYGLWGAGQALKDAGYVASRPFVWGYKLNIKTDGLGCALIATIGLLLTATVVPFCIIATSNGKPQTLKQTLKQTRGTVAYVKDNKIGFVNPSELADKENPAEIHIGQYDTPATDLVKVRWDRTGKKLLLVDEPLENTLLNADPADTALYIFDFASKKSKKLLDITENPKFLAIKEAYWSKTDNNKVYANIDETWYSINLDRDENFPHPDNLPFSPIENHESDMDTAPQTEGPYKQLEIPVRRGTLAFIHYSRTVGSYNTGTPMTAAAWWYDSAKSKKAAEDSDNAKELQGKSSKPK